MTKTQVFKDSGIQWLGQIPKHWEVRKIKQFSMVVTGKTPSETNPQEWGDVMNFVTPTDCNLNEKYILSTMRKVSLLGIEKFSSIVIPKNSILVTCIASIGKVVISQESVITNQQINSVIIDNKLAVSDFIYYQLLKVMPFIGKYYCAYSILPILNKSDFCNISLILPPLKEQKAIANYLDTKCEKIAEFISKKEHTITLLKELKDSIINKAVTQGLDENTAFKDSGIKWLGQIPKHWEVRRIKYLAYVKGRIGFHGLKSDEFQYDNGAYLVTGNDFFNNIVEWEKCRRITEERYYEDPNIHLKNNDLLITKDGSIGKVAIVKDCPKQATLNSGIFLVRVNEMLCFVRYLFYIIHSQYFKEFIAFKTCGSTILHLYQSDFNAFKIPLPPLKEQKAIANYLDDKITKIERAISNIKEQIEQMRAYKTSLINECVCGRIDLNKEEQ